MSIARKRAKVKKKSRAVRAAKKKRQVKKKAARTKKKRGKRLSVDTKPRPSRQKPKPKPKPRSKRPSPKPKPKPKPRPKKKKRRKKKRISKELISRIAEETGTTERMVGLLAFLTQPLVSQQIRDRLIEKGLAELRRGMVQTKESIILGHLIVAEQLGNFDQRAHELAAEYEMPVREVYELWWSPKLGEAAE